MRCYLILLLWCHIQYSQTILVESEFHAKIVKGVTEYLFQHKNVDSTECSRQLSQFVQDLKGPTPKQWAMLMLDATSKWPSGILSGNTVDLGAYDQCLGIEENIDRGTIHGAYCLAKIVFPLTSYSLTQEDTWNTAVVETPNKTDFSNVTITLAMCIPSACTAHNLQDILSKTGLNAVVDNLSYQSKISKPEVSVDGVITLFFLGIILILLVSSTAYDFFLQSVKKEAEHDILTAFSIIKNGKKLIAINKDPKQLPCLQGLRVLGMMWIILSHTADLDLIFPVSNVLDTWQWMLTPRSMYFFEGPLSVDTFFLLSGLVTAYSFLIARDRGINFNLLLYYVHRYIRLTPSLAVAVLIHSTLLMHMSSGPMWPITASSALIDDCKTNWWTTLLYVQNYASVDAMCLPNSWYLAVDMQLFILSPFLLLPLKKFPKLGTTIISSLICAEIMICFGVAWHYKLHPVLGTIVSSQGFVVQPDYKSAYYFPTHTRAAPWLIGILLGYYIFITKKNSTRLVLHKVTVLILWGISLAVLVACVFGGHSLLLSTTENNSFVNSLYIGLVRPTWALAMSWMIIACIYDYGGRINWFFSLPFFEILSKLTYSVYMVHHTVIAMYVLSRRTTGRFSEIAWMHNFWGNYVFSLWVAVVWTLAFESPMTVIENIIFGSGKRKPIEGKYSQQTKSKVQ